MPRPFSVYFLFLLMLPNVVDGYLLFTDWCLVAFSHRRSSVRNAYTPTLSALRGGSSDEPSAVVSLASQESSVESTDAGVHTQQSAPLLGPKAPEPGYVRRLFPRVPWHRVPNFLTYLRCVAIPLLAWVFFLPDRHVEAASIFALASLTDFLDGYLARRWDITSSFGAFLDPVADKLAVSTALILLSGRHGAMVSVPTSIILGREIAVSALREWMAQRGQRDAVQVGFQGKVKTALTMLALTLYLAIPVGGAEKGSRLPNAAQALLCLSAAVTVSSGSVYFRAAAKALRD
jgi:CDP-diacylglycerol---glycerol-3-phosphate 3-phosphatidyltransferase